MLHKIGLCKCNKNSIKYFTITSPSEKIILDSLWNPIKTIVSFMISNKILNIDVMDFLSIKNSSNYLYNYSMVNVFIEITYKVLYSSKDNKTLHVINHKSYHVVQVKIPSYLEGFSIRQLLDLKRLKGEVFIEDVHLTIENERTLMINPYIITNILPLPDYTLGYIFEMDSGENNIFVSFNDGSRLLQKTFTKNIRYKNLSWCPFTNEISYLCNNNNFFEIYTLNIHNSSQMKIKVDFNIDDIHSFCYLSNNEIILSAANNNNFDIYKINTRTVAMTKLTNAFSGHSFICPKYSHTLNIILFIQKNTDCNYLCSISTNGLDLSYLTKKKFIEDFIFDNEGKYVAYIGQTDAECGIDYNNAYIINYKTLQENKINILNDPYKIKKILFYPSKDYLALCINFNNRDDIFLYDINTCYVKNLTNNSEGIYICDFSFDFLGETLYFASNDRGNYDIYMIDLDTRTKKTLINCFSKNVLLIYKNI